MIGTNASTRTTGTSHRVMGWILSFAAVVGMPLAVSAQGIQPPTGPVVFCGTQALPAATSYTLSFDSGADEALTMDASVDAACPAGTSHSFKLPAARFTVGTHSVTVTATNQFGSTVGPAYSVVVGIAPGAFTITAVIKGA